MRKQRAELLSTYEKGQMPQAREWNTIVGILRTDVWTDGIVQVGPFEATKKRIARQYDIQHIYSTTEVIKPYGCLLVTETSVKSNSRRAPAIQTAVYSGASPARGMVAINGTRETAENLGGLCAYGYTPIIAEIDTACVVGDRVGPKATELTLIKDQPGFRVIAPPPEWAAPEHLYWVLREPGIGIGCGTLLSEDEDDFTLDNVKFFQGLNTATESDQLTVTNVYGDDFEVGLYATFWYNQADNRYEIADIECPSTT